MADVGPTNAPGRTVLLVEDEPSFVAAFAAGLDRDDFRLAVARTGREALALFDAVAPDLVLVDALLPMMSGLEVCRELRRRSRVPIIVLTAKGDGLDPVAALDVGADDFVAKPYRLLELVARMRALLR